MIFTDQNFKTEAEDNKGLVLVDFYAPWCGPCQLIEPIIDEIIKEYKDKKIKIGKLNIDENKDITEKYNIMTVPTFILFREGKILEQINNYCGKEDLQHLIDKHLEVS